MRKTVAAIMALLMMVFIAVPVRAEGDLSVFEFVSVTHTYDMNDPNETRTITGFVYNDGFLLPDNSVVHPDLAKASVSLAVAAYYLEYVSDALSQMGYTILLEGNWDRQHTSDDNDFVRYVIAAKTVQYHGEEYIIYCVPVQGTHKSYDWNSNFNLGDTENHEGFYKSRAEIIQMLYDFLSADETHDKDHTLFWSMGHSRGAAVSNIVAGELTSGQSVIGEETYDFSSLITPEHVFSYNFACPAVSTRDEVKNSGFANIINYNSSHDLIPELPMEEWGYGRYGVTVDFDPSVQDNVDQYFLDELGVHYTGSRESVQKVKNVVLRMIPDRESASKPAAKLLFSTLASLLRGNGNNAGDAKESTLSVGISITDEIRHGHMPATYVAWVNAMYFGYHGYHNCTCENVFIYDDILTVGEGCFENAETDVYLASNPLFVGERAFDNLHGDVYTAADRIIARRDSGYQVEEAVETTGFVTGIRAGTGVEALPDGFVNPKECLAVADLNGVKTESGAVATGYVLQLLREEETVDVKLLVITGECSGDGVVDVRDVKLVLNQSLGKESLDGAFLAAADADRDGLIDVRDVKLILNMSLGKT